jgi:hypothetical protein
MANVRHCVSLGIIRPVFLAMANPREFTTGLLSLAESGTPCATPQKESPLFPAG